MFGVLMEITGRTFFSLGEIISCMEQEHGLLEH